MDILNALINGYDKLAYASKYILGYSDNHSIWFCFANSSDLPSLMITDIASRNAGYALRFKPNKNQKMILKSLKPMRLCDEKEFEYMFSNSKYNRGEIFEKLITEKYNQVWKKDNIPFTESGDIIIDNIHYQIKYQKATFINEQTLNNMLQKA